MQHVTYFAFRPILFINADPDPASLRNSNPRLQVFMGELYNHALKAVMELDPQSLIGLHVHSWHWLRARNTPLPPHLGSYTRAVLRSLERRHVFVTP
jgi:hypothetical protein